MIGRWVTSAPYTLTYSIGVLTSTPTLLKLAMSTPSAPPAINNPPSAEVSLISYPSQFPIKVMGQNVDGFVHAISLIASQFDPTFDAASIELRPSKGGNYLGITITITATSRAQLDEVYRTLSAHPLVKVVL
jgi:putative lipoic acid-binding regulatory protein